MGLITGENRFRDSYLSWPPPQKQFPKSNPWKHPSELITSVWLRSSAHLMQSQLFAQTHAHTTHSTQDSFLTAEPVSQGNESSWQDSAVLCCSYSQHTMGYLQQAAACLLSIHNQTSFEHNRRERESSRHPLHCKLKTTPRTNGFSSSPSWYLDEQHTSAAVACYKGRSTTWRKICGCVIFIASWRQEKAPRQVDPYTFELSSQLPAIADCCFLTVTGYPAELPRICFT